MRSVHVIVELVKISFIVLDDGSSAEDPETPSVRICDRAHPWYCPNITIQPRDNSFLPIKTTVYSLSNRFQALAQKVLYLSL
jgi:hypothetical protein